MSLQGKNPRLALDHQSLILLQKVSERLDWLFCITFICQLKKRVEKYLSKFSSDLVVSSVLKTIYQKLSILDTTTEYHRV